MSDATVVGGVDWEKKFLSVRARQIWLIIYRVAVLVTLSLIATYGLYTMYYTGVVAKHYNPAIIVYQPPGAVYGPPVGMQPNRNLSRGNLRPRRPPTNARVPWLEYREPPIEVTL